MSHDPTSMNRAELQAYVAELLAAHDMHADIVADLRSDLAAAKEREAGLVEAMTKAADLFQWYADEHIAAGKTEKAARNQGAADALRAAIKGTAP